MEEKTNLNSILIYNRDGEDKSLRANKGGKNNIKVVFSNIKKTLLEEIHKADAVVGCVAWFTEYEVLDALATKEVVSIIVQKEDFLRPDLGSPSDFKNTLRQKYEAIKSTDRFTVGGGELSYCSDPTLKAFRCMGLKAQKKTTPRMHHKFLIFGKIVKIKDTPEGYLGHKTFKPYAVWTGSYNISQNSNYSFENAILIEDADIANLYYKEYLHILALSEPLDWEHEWVEPEWRLGS